MAAQHLALLTLLLQAPLHVPLGSDVYQAIKVDQEIMVGGLFPVHSWTQPLNSAGSCGNILKEKGMQRMEAMLYAIDRINNSTSVLQHHRLGVHVLDTCTKDTYAFKQAFDFIQLVMSGSNIAAELYTCANGQMPEYNEPTPVAAVIGAASSVVSVQVANLLGQFKIPQISYSSTGTRLSDRMRYEYFSRVVPPDNLQANAMVDVVAALNWTFVHAIADRGDYGELGVKNFKDIAQKRGIWIDGHVHIIDKWQDLDYEQCLASMKATKKARGVIMFVNEEGINQILKALELLSLEDESYVGYFMMIASDSWGTKSAAIANHETMAIGAITVAPKQQPDTGFDDYFKRLTPNAHGGRDVWFNEFWSEMRCTSAHRNLGQCMLANDYVYKQESYVSYVIDAVDVLARALDRYLDEECSTYHTEPSACHLKFNGHLLQTYYRNVSFEKGENPKIDHNGDGIGEYIIYQFTYEHQYKAVGHWMDGTLLEFNVSAIADGLSVNGTGQIPMSVCSLPCQKGYYMQIPENKDSSCWMCIECYSSVNYKSIQPTPYSCVRCENHTMPNAAKNECIALVPEVIQWSSPWALAPAVFSAFGISATCVVIYTFIKYNKTPVIMASGRELCYFMIVGISCCYLMTYVLVAPPTMFTCAAVRIGLGGSLACIYGAILTKTSRLARVFRTQIKSTKPPKFISPLSQVGICGGIVCAQVGGTLVWLVVLPAQTTIVYNELDTEAVLSCAATTTTLLISLSYNIVLIIMCTFYAFKTRKIPENFNETKYIGFTMYATCIIWMAFVPIYFATADQFRIQITSFSACISLSGTVALGCFFAPKVYIVLFQPEKNVRNKGAVRALFSQQMAVLRQNAGNPEVTNTARGSSDAHSAQPLLANHHGTNHNNNNNNNNNKTINQSATIETVKQSNSTQMTSSYPPNDHHHDPIKAKTSTVSVVNAQVISSLPQSAIHHHNGGTPQSPRNAASRTASQSSQSTCTAAVNGNAPRTATANGTDWDALARTVTRTSNAAAADGNGNPVTAVAAGSDATIQFLLDKTNNGGGKATTAAHHHAPFAFANGNQSELRMRKSQSMPSGSIAKRFKRPTEKKTARRSECTTTNSSNWSAGDTRATVELILQELATNKEETFV